MNVKGEQEVFLPSVRSRRAVRGALICRERSWIPVLHEVGTHHLDVVEVCN